MKKSSILLLCFVLGFSACKKEDEIGEENELITTIKLNFKNGTDIKSFSYKDLDGDGGITPVIDKISLAANTTYDLSIEFLDESKSPAVNITQEVSGESDEHLVLFTPSTIALGTYSYADKDVNLLPIGLIGKYSTQSAGMGMLKVQLRHQPPINGKNTKDGTSIPGSDDINIDFALEVK
ncbi:hypothetical protein EGI26_17310 [Lacihabitans sp. CCS-44]|uniref:hypothetical protein n=1 Tax=Lacihabitans sp. CCS-44 TaxID=2487331 RepID=UPI0020CF907F|nr:hypothetical protein [Lacihabitans sp. CCS-44]MCP9756926.1 hypothetical protein [Lacihabitans sp. CCS-44]